MCLTKKIYRHQNLFLLGYNGHSPRQTKYAILTIEFLGKKITGPFTIPSGIVSTSTTIIDYIFRNIPEIGVVTSKSIGPAPRAGNREPIYSQYAKGCFVNAVGLTNPGADESARLFSELVVPDDRFLLISIFGGSVEEYVEVAKKLAPFCDGLELNLSCPHAKGFGMAMGQDPELVKEITAQVKAAVSIPVIPKLTPNAPNLAEITAAAIEGGADAICAINTVGPGFYSAKGHAVLSNKEGGMSGKGILPIGLKCVREIATEISKSSDIPIIGCGGISSADDVRAYQQAGASIFGIGSALTGLTSPQMEAYFTQLSQDMSADSNIAESMIDYDVDMGFQPFTLIENKRITDDIVILTFDKPLQIEAGEFVFLWIPELGEKPFSALTDDPFSLVVIQLGEFTSELMKLEPGSVSYVRGPYGIKISPPENAKILGVAGGTGLAAVHQLARDYKDVELFLGARTKERLYFLDESAACSTLHVATDDGSEGYKGVVTELLRQRLAEMSAEELANVYCYNCGPEPMVHAATKVQSEFLPPEQIFSAIDYLTKCGVGICGACGSPDGRRLCMDGPFLVSR
jgi:dihydroorotate dehydrogenase (NAD+) catalytic subunit